MDKMSKDDNILLWRIPKHRDLLSTYKFALVENKNREWYLADNLTDVLTWLKASVNFGYEREKKTRKGKKKKSTVPADYAWKNQKQYMHLGP